MSAMLQHYTGADFPREGDDQSLDPWHYLRILKKRLIYIIASVGLVLGIGFATALLLPPVYLSEGRILVESQQIPTDLVRPTITATARERLQVIEQRVMTRDNLLGVMDKFQVFPDEQRRLSRTELLALMRENTVIRPMELDVVRRGANATVAMTVGFKHRRPDVATRVANELMTLFLSEDARNRAARAVETTRFLDREVKRLEGELASVERKFAELRVKQIEEPKPETSVSQIAMLRNELTQKSAVYSRTHPEIRRLRAQIAALEKTAVAPAPTTPAKPDNVVVIGLEGLESQRDFVQQSLDTAKQKLAAARLGENLERDQFSERLEVIEQAIVPQIPIQPNRLRIIAFTILLAAVAGVGAVFLVETFDRTIRGSGDLLSVIGSHSLVTVPYIATSAELSKTKSRVFIVIAIVGVIVIAGLVVAHFLLRPLDELWFILLQRLSMLWPI